MEILTKENARKFRAVMLILEDGTKKTLPPYNAFALAEQEGKDLVCVSDKPPMPVCKLMNFEKMKYEKEKALKDQKRQQRLNQVAIKEIQISFTIALNDMKTKAKKIKEFIEDGDIVRIVLRLRGREMAYQEQAGKKVDEMIELCKEFAQVKKDKYLEGRDIKVMLEKRK